MIKSLKSCNRNNLSGYAFWSFDIFPESLRTIASDIPQYFSTIALQVLWVDESCSAAVVCLSHYDWNFKIQSQKLLEAFLPFQSAKIFPQSTSFTDTDDKN